MVYTIEDSAMASDTVRVKPETHAKLKAIAAQTGRPMPEVLEQAVETLRRQRLLEATNAAYAALRDDTKAWKSELAERDAWENTLGDDLEND
jgi:predicted transcriptional regulator